MRKLETFFDIKVKELYQDRNTLEEFYFNLVTSGKEDFITPLKNLKDLQTDYNDKIGNVEFERNLLANIIDNFRAFLLKKPDEMQEIISDYENEGHATKFYSNNERTTFCEELLEALRYNTMLGGGNRGKDLARTLNIKSCLYCNSQYSFSYKYDKDRVSKLQLDHFFSKSKYPYFSISLYNLIPTCSYCNQKKSNTDFNLSEYFNPYNDSISEKFKFALSESSDKKVYLDYLVDESDVEIILEKNDLKVQNHNNVFDLEGIYSNHKDVVHNLFKMAKAYPKIKRKAILKISDGNGNMLFKNEDDLKKLIFNMPLEESEINSMPLSKLKQDFAIRLGVLKQNFKPLK
jgi:hypothetical protein